MTREGIIESKILDKCFFSFFFFILIFWLVRGLNGQKIAQNENKSYICQALYLFLAHILIFQVVSGVKKQKMAQNDKKFCLPHSIP